MRILSSPFLFLRKNGFMKKRCTWCENTFEEYERYHDEEWGVPVHDDKTHFEFLILEGAQAGLSWSTVLKKREGVSSVIC